MPPGRPARPFDRIAVVVCDSVGCGRAPDAAAFGDEGANTLASVIEQGRPRLPHLARLGLDRIIGVPPLEGAAADTGPTAAWGRMVELSAAKDTMTGHWELMGVVSDDAFPVYPNGFPAEIVGAFESAIGRRILGNCAASGTEIIQRLGTEHLASGAPIVYTSGDSVFQVAAHEDVIPVDALYDMCGVARRLLDDEHRVARVIARPFAGSAAEGFSRTTRRRDFALPPPTRTVLDRLLDSGRRTRAIGKINDIFAGRGVTSYVKTSDNADGVRQTCAALQDGAAELVFTNLVDFDSSFGHRRDVAGYAAALAAFDRMLPRLLGAVRPGYCLILTADHGNDPCFRGTDHTRECVPLLVYSDRTRPRDLGTRASFADVGSTIADNFELELPATGTSFLAEVS